MENAKNPIPLLDWLSQEKTLYDQLLQKVREQKSAVEMDDETGLLKIITEKDRLIHSIRQMDEKIQNWMRQAPDHQRAPVNDATGPIRDEIENRVEEIIALEASCRKILGERRALIGDQIKSLKSRKTMLKGYGDRSRTSIYYKKV